MSTDKAVIKNIDAFISAATGAGIEGRDKFTSYAFRSSSELSDQTLEELYEDHDLAATIVERIVHDALRSGYELGWQGASDEQRRDVRDWAESEYEVTKEAKQSRIYARLYGGGAIFMGVEGEGDGRAIMGQDVRFLRSVPKPELRGETWYADPMWQDFGSVATYMYEVPTFRPTASEQSQKISPVRIEMHESRFVPFYGTTTTSRKLWQNKGWGKSVLHRVYDVLLKFDASYDSVLHTLSEQSIPVYKVKALLDLLASENGELLAKRFELINVSKGAYRAVILDMEEDLSRVEANLSSASAVVDSAMIRVAGAAGMPVTILFGREPAGQNATGKADLENWNQQVASEQSLILGPAIAKVYRWLLAQPESPLKGKVPADLKVIFPAVETPSLQDQVNLYAQRAGADVAYINSKVLKPEQVALKRAEEPGQFPGLTAADKAFAREMMKLRNEQMLNPPDPLAMMGQASEEENEEEPEQEQDSNGIR